MTARLKWTTHADLEIERHPSVLRDEFLDYMTFRRNDRPLFTELFGPLVGLKEEWEAQGATPAELSFSVFRYRCADLAPVDVCTGRLGAALTPIRETETTALYLDDLGRTMRLEKGRATVPLPLDHPVKNMDDWLRIKHKYEFSEDRFNDGWEGQSQRAREGGKVVSVDIPGGFDEPRQLLGEEGLCCAYYDQPELIHDILDTIAQTAFTVLDRVSRTVPVDCLGVHEDMAGKSGSLIGPSLIAEFIQPYYRRIWDMLAGRGARVFDQDSDGDMNSVIPAFLDAGVNCMHPMEPAANMDVVQVRQQYGSRLAFVGGIDKHVIRRSREEIVSELEYKLPPMIRTGGCVLSLDHRIPNGTPLENYRFYVNKVWEIIEREAGSA